MRVQGDWIAAPSTQDLCAVLARGGHRALFVGGCVRNALLGVPVADIDLSTDARPDRVTALCRAAGLKVVPTGIDHGTVTVITGGIAHEVTTFRRDVETFGRRAVVAFSDDVAEDAARRDFTMNALYAEASGAVIDPLGGLPDLIARRVRFVGEAGQRIREDYLRILRFFRFHAIHGDPGAGLDAEGLAACAELADGIGQLSRERVGAEMRKLLLAADPAPAVAAMAQAGVLTHVLPGADPRALAVLVHLEDGRAPDWLARLVCLGGDDPGVRLRLSRADARTLAVVRAEIAEGRPPAELGYRLGPAEGAAVVLARAALQGAPPAHAWAEDLARGAAARFPIRAADLMPALQGPALGARLKALEDRWIASDFRLTRGDLLE